MFKTSPKFIHGLSSMKARYESINQHMTRQSNRHVISSERWDVECITSTPTPHMPTITHNRQFEAHCSLTQDLGGIMAQYAGSLSNDSSWWWSALVQLIFRVRIPNCILLVLRIF